MQARTAGRKHRSIRYAKWGYLFIAPFFIAFAVFQLLLFRKNEKTFQKE